MTFDSFETAVHGRPLPFPQGRPEDWHIRAQAEKHDHAIQYFKRYG
jgi:hypothetical protein